MPIYLSHWDVNTYGVWLSVAAITGVLTLIDFGHQEFLTYEFLRIGHDNRPELSRYLWTSIAINLLLNASEVVLMLLFLNSDALLLLLNKSDQLSPALIHSASILVILQTLMTPLASIAGLFFRSLAPFGHFTRTIWWSFYTAVITAIVPTTAVIFGADLLTAGITMTCATILLHVPIYVDIVRLLRKENIKFSRPVWSLGYLNFTRSLAIFGKLCFESVRQQGIRLILAPLVGAAGLVAFSTMRTGANVALQGLRTITNPLMPDLVRFLHQRDQDRVDVSFGVIWVMVIALLAPGVVVLQFLIEPFYTAWTRGQVTFDPFLFATLSLSVLIYAVAQPATAVAVGNNILKSQLTLTALAAVVVAVGIWFFVPINGLLGAGIALLLAEIAVMIGYQRVAERWLRTHGLSWPKRAFAIALTSVGIAAGAMVAIAQFPQMKWGIFPCSLLLFGWNFWRYWRILPVFATDRIRGLLRSLPGVKKLSILRLN